MMKPPCAPSRIVMGLCVQGVLAFGVGLTAQPPLTFDVASIKLNRDSTGRTTTRQLPDGTVIITDISIRNLLVPAWPSEDTEYRNLPAWAMRNHYDVTVKPPVGAAPDQMQEMWRALFKERFKLEVHTEPRDTPIYALVLARADGTLGPHLKPSPHTCPALAAAAGTAPPAPPRTTTPSDAEIMASCRSWFTRDRMITGGMRLSALARALWNVSGRFVEDRTGLEGFYAITLTYSTSAPPGSPEPTAAGDAPSIFTAVQEQLGLKLEPARKPLQTVVIDRIEPPTEN